MTRAAKLAALVLSLWLGAAAPAEAGSPFADWAAVVVAGDAYSQSGRPSEAFDNARRDVSQALVRLGFTPGNMRQFSTRPERYRERPQPADVARIYESLAHLSGRGVGGCLFYLSSHGAPSGVIVADQVLAPGVLASMLDETCRSKPTIVVVSACFSGVFVPALARPNRMVLTAARPDRSSFGCGEADRYPYFDDCFLSSLKGARDFPGLGRAVQACVAAREASERVSPASEPQLWIGAALKPLLPLYGFAGGAAAPR